ncbi:anti-sigma factor family protein, partial [Roseiarcus sp.]|uniref:anti-sigma factor family protein n=1 Tax=Roseiarcus sp. TaxID=1969460 RepID=UPI003C4600F3
MNDPASRDRILRLNAALDGELDAASSLELEREMRANPALAAEYRRLEALRASMARLVPRETAPKKLADRIAALGAPAADSASASAAASVVPFARPPVRRPNWS